MCFEKNAQIFKSTKQTISIYRENVLYPYFPMKESKMGLILENRDNDDIHQFEEINVIFTWFCA